MNDSNISSEQALFKAKINTCRLICVIIILSIIVTIQFIRIYGTNDELLKQFSFASTITSIILSVIAIIMTVVSSDSINSLLHKFRDLHNEIKDTPRKINSSVEKINFISEKIEESKTVISDTISQLDTNVTQISTATEDMKKVLSKIERTLGVINENTSNNQNFIKNSVVNDSENNSSTDLNEKSSFKISSYIIIMMSSHLGLYLFYSLVLAYQDKKILDLSKISKCIDFDQAESSLHYLMGYLTAFISISYVFAVWEDEKKSISNFIIQYINDDLSLDLIDKEIELRIENRSIEDYRVEIKRIINNSPNIPQENE